MVGPVLTCFCANLALGIHFPSFGGCLDDLVNGDAVKHQWQKWRAGMRWAEQGPPLGVFPAGGVVAGSFPFLSALAAVAPPAP